jgi:site-specific DNA-methyltransferase (adenine-specific)
MNNTLYYGDNLDVLREHIADESVDLIYLDPPFNSNASYNILFKSPAGAGADASIEAFDDTWAWGPTASSALMDITQSGNHKLHVLMQAMKTAIGENAMMAYLAMMAVRLVELHRVLKPTGSLYLHCDPTASHYLKLVLDAVFGADGFRTEISWKRSSAHNDAKQGRVQYGNIRDIIFFYTKAKTWTWHTQYTSYDEKYIQSAYRHVDSDGRRYRKGDLTAAKPGGDVSYPWPVMREVSGDWISEWEADLGNEYLQPLEYKEYRQVPPYKGRYWAFSRDNMENFALEGKLAYSSSGMPEYKRYLDEQQGVPLQNEWDDIYPVTGNERLGYPTQKPRALLERIIAASSNPGDVVLDPFCGCGTAVDAAQKLGRRWIGIDVTHLAIGLIEKRMREGYGDDLPFETIGSPKDLASAERLAVDDPHQFQHWITLKLGGYPWMGGKKGGDKGVDGYFYYIGEGGATETGVISVKAGGNVNPNMVRDIGRVMARDGHKLGLFVTATLPTKGMVEEANSHGLIETEFGRFSALQTYTLAELFSDIRPKLPPLVSVNRKAARVETRKSHQPGSQGGLDL